jgi:HSP20 family protein
MEEVNVMSTVREILPKKVSKSALPISRNLPFGQGVEDLFENFINRGWLDPFMGRRSMLPEIESRFDLRYPLVDLVDQDHELVVRAELPGVKKDEIELTITDEGLSIVVNRELKEEDKAERFYRCEMVHGTMERSVMFPIEVDVDKAKAELKDGLLSVVIPKAKKSKRHILKVA